MRDAPLPQSVQTLLQGKAADEHERVPRDGRQRPTVQRWPSIIGIVTGLCVAARR